MKVLRRAFVGGVTLGCVMLLASGSSAQSISGSVTDDTGGVMPGVTVTVASPALIEQQRVAVTDGGGLYTVTDLRPGTYSVTFVLPGFNTVVREGIELTTGFTANVDVVLAVGAIEETVTVTGASPVIDIQNVQRQNVVPDQLLDVLPSSAKTLTGLTKLIPGVKGAADVGGAAGIWATGNVISDTVHGKGGVKFAYDGLQTNNFGGSGATSYVMNPWTVEETTVQTGGISPESNASAVSINLIPREGGNNFSFIGSALYSNDSVQSENLSDDLRSRGVENTNKVLHVYDMNGVLGGPLVRDKLWFLLATRGSGNKSQVEGVFLNATQGTLFYTPDPNRPSFRKEWLKSLGGRLTWQASQNNKISGFVDVQNYMVRGRGGNNAPEAHTCWSFWPQGLYQATWTSTLTSRLLLSAGTSLTKGPWPCTREDRTDVFGFTVAPTDISVFELSTGFRYNAAATYLDRQDQDRYAHRFSVSYVTGTHNFKTGMTLQQGVVNTGVVANLDRNYNFFGGVPASITQHATPYLAKNRIKADLGVYVQDQWTLDQLSLNLGVRLDHFVGYVPDQVVAATPSGWIPERRFDEVRGVPSWTDLNPRLGAAYDLFGTGRTALKVSLGRYVGVTGTELVNANNPITRSVNSVGRTWNDINGDFVPDCDLGNFDGNGECGPISNRNFGMNNPNATVYDEELTSGFGKRDHFWDLSVEVQQELVAGVSMLVGYNRNWTSEFSTLGGFVYNAGVTDNLLVTPEDYDPFCITAPVDPALPNGGGYEVCGLYDVTPGKFGQFENFVTRASDFGDRSRVSDFVSFVIDARLDSGATLGFSVDTGRTKTDNCFVVDSPQSLLHCEETRPFGAQTQIKINGSYPLPGGFNVSGLLQNLGGIPVLANYSASNAEVAPTLGRNLAACGSAAVCNARVTVPLIEPHTVFEPRRNQLDVRLSKFFELGGGARFQAKLDVYNVTNASSVLQMRTTYGPQWRQPLGSAITSGFLEGRLFQFGGQVTF